MRPLKVSSAALWVLGLLAIGPSSCDPIQPKPQCKVRRQPYAAAYFVEGATPTTCQGKVLSGETLLLQTYSPDPRNSTDTPGMGIEPAIVAELVDAVEASMTPGAVIESEYSFGKFTTITPPEDSDFCAVGPMQPTKIATPMIVAKPDHKPEPIDAHAAANLTYEWSEVRSLVRATLNGVHFGGKLVRTDGACTLTYQVSAVTPAVHCGNGTKDHIDEETGMPVVDPATGKPEQVADPESGQPDQGLCCPNPDNGLAPEVSYKCDAATLLCLPGSQFPSFDTTGENSRCAK